MADSKHYIMYEKTFQAQDLAAWTGNEAFSSSPRPTGNEALSSTNFGG